jgi:hypothetical protein
MGPRGKFLFTGPLGLRYTTKAVAVINQVAQTHPTADSVSAFHTTPTSITFTPGPLVLSLLFEQFLLYFRTLSYSNLIVLGISRLLS